MNIFHPHKHDWNHPDNHHQGVILVSFGSTLSPSAMGAERRDMFIRIFKVILYILCWSACLSVRLSLSVCHKSGDDDIYRISSLLWPHFSALQTNYHNGDEARGLILMTPVLLSSRSDWDEGCLIYISIIDYFVFDNIRHWVSLLSYQ